MLRLDFTHMQKVPTSPLVQKLPPYILVTPKCVLWQTVKNPDEMPHNVTFHSGIHCLLRQK